MKKGMLILQICCILHQDSYLHDTENFVSVPFGSKWAWKDLKGHILTQSWMMPNPLFLQ